MNSAPQHVHTLSDYPKGTVSNSAISSTTHLMVKNFDAQTNLGSICSKTQWTDATKFGVSPARNSTATSFYRSLAELFGAVIYNTYCLDEPSPTASLTFIAWNL